MSKFLPIICFTLSSLVITAGVIYAATTRNITPTLGGVDGDFFDLNGTLLVDSIKVGAQGTGGVTFFNGTIINNTTTNSQDNPVTFGGNVRIDGRVYRGSTAGPSDTQPFIINDNLEVAGSLSFVGQLPASQISFDNTDTDFTATTVQEAIEETMDTSQFIRYSGTFDVEEDGDWFISYNYTHDCSNLEWTEYSYDHYKLIEIPEIDLEDLPYIRVWGYENNESDDLVPGENSLWGQPSVLYGDGYLYFPYKNVDIKCSGETTTVYSSEGNYQILLFE